MEMDLNKSNAAQSNPLLEVAKIQLPSNLFEEYDTTYEMIKQTRKSFYVVLDHQNYIKLNIKLKL